MLENGLITFDYLWALWKPGTLAYATTYGASDHPRVFRVDRSECHSSMFKGQFYHITGKVSFLTIKPSACVGTKVFAC